MSLIQKMANYKQAAILLRDPNLVWSADLDCIREDLASFIESSILSENIHSATLNRIVESLISDE